MKLEIHNGLSPMIIEATRVIVKDMYDNPIAVAVEVENGIIVAETASNEKMAEFNSILRSLGVTKTTIVKDATQKSLPEIY